VILANRGGQQRDPRMWCCVSNWVRFVPQVGGLLYATAPDALYVNLFAQSSATIQIAEGRTQNANVASKYVCSRCAHGHPDIGFGLCTG
jgi:DUF1680 family protein